MEVVQDEEVHVNEPESDEESDNEVENGDCEDDEPFVPGELGAAVCTLLGEEESTFIDSQLKTQQCRWDYLTPALPSVEVRANCFNAIEALRRGKFDFDSVRDAKANTASYDGMISTSLIKCAPEFVSAGNSDAPESTATHSAAGQPHPPKNSTEQAAQLFADAEKAELEPSVAASYSPTTVVVLCDEEGITTASANISTPGPSEHPVAVMHVLTALACVQAANNECARPSSADSIESFLVEAAEHLQLYRSEVVAASPLSPTSTSACWDPLFLLAIARLIRCAAAQEYGQDQESVLIKVMPIVSGGTWQSENGQSVSALQKQLIAAFQHAATGWPTWVGLRAISPDCQQWLQADDLARIQVYKPPKKKKGRSAASPVPAPALDSSSAAEQEWKRLQSMQLLVSDSLVAAMQQLFELVGLETVKAQAVAIYQKVWMDLQLPAPVRISATLNFAFMGK